MVYNVFMEENKMNDENTKRIFSKNLNYYLSLNNKQQNEVAKDIGENPSTLNMWCKGNSMPGLGKVQKLADYFKIGKSDLLDEKLDSDATVDASILANAELMDFIKMYNSLPVDDKSAIRQIVISLHEKNKAEPN